MVKRNGTELKPELQFCFMKGQRSQSAIIMLHKITNHDGWLSKSEMPRFPPTPASIGPTDLVSLQIQEVQGRVNTAYSQVHEIAV